MVDFRLVRFGELPTQGRTLQANSGAHDVECLLQLLGGVELASVLTVMGKKCVHRYQSTRPGTPGHPAPEARSNAALRLCPTLRPIGLKDRRSRAYMRPYANKSCDAIG